jgi:hypothetical protein
MSLSLVAMLVAGESLSADAGHALRENRLEDAAELLMRDHGLTCAEAIDLLDTSVR